MPWLAAAGAVIGGLGSYFGGKEASKGADASINEQRRQFDLMMGLQQPFYQTGVGANNALAKAFGLPYQTGPVGMSNPNQQLQQAPAPTQKKHHGGLRGFLGKVIDPKRALRGVFDPAGALLSLGSNQNPLSANSLVDPAGLFGGGGGGGGGGAAAGGYGAQGQVVNPSGPDMSGFFQSPGYQFRLNEGLKGTEQSAAARGGAFSGNALRGVNDYAQGTASDEFMNWYNQLSNLAGRGQVSGNSMGQGAMQSGYNVGNALQDRGNARGTGLTGIAGALGGGLQDYAFWDYLNKGRNG